MLFSFSSRQNFVLVAGLTVFFFLAYQKSAESQTLNHVPLYTIEGDLLEFLPIFLQPARSTSGFDVSSAGDVNGDGFDDVILADEDVNIVEDLGVGRVRVMSGVDGSEIHRFLGQIPEDRNDEDGFGHSASGAGDVNGDGFDDIIVGTPRYHGADDIRDGDLGKAQVFSGADGSELYSFIGSNRSALLGFFVSGAGDVNGDGFDDVIIGEPGYQDQETWLRPGCARVISGVDGSELYHFTEGYNQSVGLTRGDVFGSSVNGAGDVNGDGFDDVIIGAPGVATHGFQTGCAYVYSGFDGSVLYKFSGENESESFGSAVNGVGDLNGDGSPDFVITSNIARTARVFSGADGNELYRLTDVFSAITPGMVDFNGDGHGDFIIRSTTSGIVFDGVPARVVSGFDGTDLYTFNGAVRGAGAGDVNGDGLDDFIIVNTLGQAVVYASRVVGAGDVNGDGVPNFLDIAPFIAVLSSGQFQDEADINRDGVVDFLDIASFIAILSSQ